MMLEAYNISIYVQLAGSVAVAISCLFNYRRRAASIRLLGFYAIASISFSLAQEISAFFFSYVGLNTIGNGSVLSETIFFSLLFYFATQNTKFKKGIITSGLLYGSFYLITFLFFSDRSYSFIRFGRDFLMIVYAIAYFYYLIQKLPEDKLLKFPMFWINSAIIFFFSGTFILSLMVDYIVAVLDNDLTGFWAFRNLFRFMFCIVLTYAGWLDWQLIKPRLAKT